ncbi:MAG: MmgE/PrpD family protein [Bacillota bacterium]|nr:MmgE/PrpD family protein [Bacillota bacterium]
MQDLNMQVSNFIKKFSYDHLPQQIQRQVKLCVLDLLGAVLGGSQTKVAQIAREFARVFWPENEATIIMGGAKSNCIGATFANAFQANAIDIDDGFRLVKGHPGALVIPAALAVAEAKGRTGKELLEAIIVGYEVGTRAGIIWHDHYPLYHASGAWGSVATAAVTAKLLNLDVSQIYNALGIAEYQAPINPMMRCIDYPAMVKDGIGWGAQAGVTSALMALHGFTGVPSLFGLEKYRDIVKTLGAKYNILQLYFKPYACCRWAQPAIAGALKIMQESSLQVEQIKSIDVYTFKESARLWCKPPRTTEEAQYNISYPIAAAVHDGEVGPKQVLDDKLSNKKILELLTKIRIIADERFDKSFPQIAQSEVCIADTTGRLFWSGVQQAKGDFDNPLTEAEIHEKFYWLAGQVKPSDHLKDLVNIVYDLENIKDLTRLYSLLN